MSSFSHVVMKYLILEQIDTLYSMKINKISNWCSNDTDFITKSNNIKVQEKKYQCYTKLLQLIRWRRIICLYLLQPWKQKPWFYYHVISMLSLVAINRRV